MRRISLFSTFLLIALAAAAFKCGGSSDGSSSSGNAEWNGMLPGRFQAVTPMGVKVRSDRPINERLFSDIDAGLSDTFATASTPPEHYDGFQRHSAYTVGLFPRSSLCQQAGFTIRADGSEWDGTDYDKDPRPGRVLLCIAGIAGQYATGMSGTVGGSRGMLVVEDADIMRTIIRFEAEHEVLFEVDEARYDATSGVHAHPLLGVALRPYTSERTCKAVVVN